MASHTRRPGSACLSSWQIPLCLVSPKLSFAQAAQADRHAFTYDLPFNQTLLLLILHHRSGSSDAPEGNSTQASSNSQGPTQPLSKPQIPFLAGSNSTSSTRGSAKASAAPLIDKQGQGSSHRHLTPVSSDPQAGQAEPPVRPRPPSRPQSSSSQHQLQDLGFEDVDLDSPDATVSKTRSDQAQPINQSHIMPIPFMQHAPQHNVSASTANTDDFGITDSISNHHSDTHSPSPFAPPVQVSTGRSHLEDQSAAPSAVSHDQHADDLFAATDSSAETAQHSGAPAASRAGLLPEVPSAPSAGPFSTDSGPPSTSSSTPASPGGPGAGVPPARRSSFLPRGMSSHLQKAFKATAAAASKASAAIAPPPNSTSDASPSSAWQEHAQAQQPALSLTIPKGDQDLELPFQEPWGPSGPASTANQDRKQHGKPWWQQQLQHLQHNLQSSQQLQSDAASDLDTASMPGSSPAALSQLDGPFQDHSLRLVTENGNVPIAGGSSLQSDNQEEEAQSLPAARPLALQEPGAVSAKAAGYDQQRQQMNADSMRIMDSLVDADGVSASEDQHPGTMAGLDDDWLDNNLEACVTVILPVVACVADTSAVQATSHVPSCKGCIPPLLACAVAADKQLPGCKRMTPSTSCLNRMLIIYYSLYCILYNSSEGSLLSNLHQ